MQPVVRFPYRVSELGSFGGLLLGAVWVLGFGYWAFANEKGISFGRGLLTLSPTVASVLFGVIAAVGVLATVMMSFLFARSRKGPMEIILDRTEIVAPRGSLRMEMLRIPYAAITSVAVQQIQKNQMLIIGSIVGESRVLSTGFESNQAFDEFRMQLSARLKTGDGRSLV